MSKVGARIEALAIERGLNPVTLAARLTRGWPLERALSTATHRHEMHGQGNRTPEYKAWSELRQRCENTNKNQGETWARYGGRGIGVCARWRESFAAFLSDMGPRPSSRHSIDRTDNDGDYEPGNCRWATSSEQALNRRRCVRLTHQGRTQTVTEWARELGIDSKTIFARLYKGDAPERALRPLIQQITPNTKGRL